MPPKPPPGLFVSLKITLLGPSKVGKTSLAVKLCRGQVDQELRTTVGVDFLHHSVRIGNRKVNLHVWDTAGQERFASVLPSFIRGSSGVIIVFDVTEMASFSAVTYWLNVAKSEVPDADVVLVGNKVDSLRRTVSRKEGEEYAQSKGMTYIETSAFSGHNVENLFHDLAERIILKSLEVKEDKPNGIVLKEESRKKKCRC